jgi:hypothetical protein
MLQMAWWIIMIQPFKRSSLELKIKLFSETSMSESNVFRERNYVVIIGEEDESKEESKTDESYLMIIQSYVTRILKKKLISGYEDIKREVQEMAQSRFRL